MRRMQAGQTGANLFLNDFEVCDRYGGGLAAAARVTCPATLILGARDQMTMPRQAVDIGAALRAERPARVRPRDPDRSARGALAALRAALGRARAR